MRKDTKLILESLSLKETFGPSYNKFIKMLTPDITTVFKFSTYEDGVGDFDIYDMNNKRIGSIYNDTSDSGYYEVNIKNKTKKFKTIEEVIGFLDNIAKNL